MSTSKSPKPAVIKKYANRRLYDTQTSAYITLDDLCQRVKAGEDFRVVDAKTGDDLTRQVLAQIIFEQETKGFNMLPTDFLRNVIQFYDHGMKDVLSSYLESSMKGFVANQDRLKGMFSKAMMGSENLPFNMPLQLEEMTKKNMALFEQTLSMFNPFAAFTGDEKNKKK